MLLQKEKNFFNFADLMKKNILELGLLETLNMGKPITRATGDMSCINCTKWYAEAIDKLYDDRLNKDNLIATIKRTFGCSWSSNSLEFSLLMAC